MIVLYAAVKFSVRFEVVEGSVDVFHHGAWHTLKAGDVAVVPPCMPDQFKNTSAAVARVRCRIAPVLDFQDMNVALMKLIHHFALCLHRQEAWA